MNVHFVKITYMVLFTASTVFSKGVDISGSPVSSSYYNYTLNDHRMLRINISDARGKRHNLPLVEVDNADLHRIATCTKAPGRLICKSGRYNYVINNGNFEFPAETLEKFVSALYQKAKDQKESDFAVALVAPEKEAVTPSTSNLQLASMKSETTESVDQLQPVTIECELTDAKTLKETNPDYQPKPNERVFKCITKRLGIRKKKRHQQALVIGSGHYENFQGRRTRRIKSIDRIWKLFHPPWEMPENRVRKRSMRSLSSYSRKQPRSFVVRKSSSVSQINHGIPDVVKKSDFEAIMYQRPEMVDEGDANEKNVVGYYHHEYPRPRVRDYNYTCIDVQTLGWCPPLRSTGCLPDIRLRSSTLHPVFYTESSEDRRRKYRHLKRIAYKIRNPFLELLMPYGFSNGAQNGVLNRHKSPTEARSEDENHYTIPDSQSLSRRLLNTIAVSYETHTESRCHAHDNSGENTDHGGSSDDEDDNNNDTIRAIDNNCDNVNMRAGVRKGSKDEKALIQHSNECTKNNKKGNKNGQRMTTNKRPRGRKKISERCPCPTEVTPSAQISKQSPNGKMCRPTKGPTCPCKCRTVQEESSSGSTVCTVIRQRICIGKRNSIAKPMNFIRSERDRRYLQQPQSSNL